MVLEIQQHACCGPLTPSPPRLSLRAQMFSEDPPVATEPATEATTVTDPPPVAVEPVAEAVETVPPSAAPLPASPEKEKAEKAGDDDTQRTVFAAPVPDLTQAPANVVAEVCAIAEGPVVEDPVTKPQAETPVEPDTTAMTQPAAPVPVAPEQAPKTVESNAEAAPVETIAEVAEVVIVEPIPDPAPTITNKRTAAEAELGPNQAPSKEPKESDEVEIVEVEPKRAAIDVDASPTANAA